MNKTNACILSLAVFMMFLLWETPVNAQQLRSFQVQDATLEECLKIIKNETGLGYLLKGEDVKSVKGIDYSARNVQVRTILNAILKDTGFAYEIEKGVILVFKKDEPTPAPETSAEEQKTFTIYLTLLDKDTREPLVGAVAMVQEYQSFGVADYNGVVTLRKLPAGKVYIETQFIGYEPFGREVIVNQDLNLVYRLEQTSLALQEVTVVARASAAGTSTSSSIGRQAMDHLQATSLKDIMQLLPGQLLTGAQSMTSAERFTIRTLNTTDANNAFGTAILVDGVPLSDNASMENRAGISTSGGTGVDLREIGADNIESIEVIRGIPSAEYGDLTSGAVIVNTRAGASPYEIRTKVNPSVFNTSLSKGWNLGRDKGSLHYNVDYAQSWGDPRQKTASFDRIAGGVAYTNTFNRIWYTNTRINFSNLLDFRGSDPDVIMEGTETEQKSLSLRFSHNGRFSINRKFMRTLAYSFGVSQSLNESTQSTIVAAGGGLPVITAMHTGYHEVPYLFSSYRTSGGTIARPVTVFAKASNRFFFNHNNLHQRFNMGVDYRMSQNNARGFYNDDPFLPLRPTSNGRPRPFYDIPVLHQVSAFFEDNINWKFGDNQYFRLQAGMRYELSQPGMEEQVSSWSPRLNSALRLTNWVEFRAGWGKNSKTPGLTHLYPDARYIDRVAALYLPNDPAQQLVMYHTFVNHVERNSMLINSTNTKTEIGADFTLPNEMTLSVVAYEDNMEGGFGSYSDYMVFYSNFYSLDNGLIMMPDGKPIVEWQNPERTDTVFATKGIIGNTQASLDRGVEFDMYFGQIQSINTQLYLSGAYMESQSWSTGPSYSNPVGIPASSVYGQGGSNTPPFKLEYPSGVQRSIQRRFSSVMRAVCNIPQMRMVASLNGQVIWQTYSRTTNQRQLPIGWIDTDLSYHEITDEMWNDPDYEIKGISLQEQIRDPRETRATILPPVWLVSARLSKDISQSMRLSFFSSNMFFYTPYQTSNISNTPIERNANTFSFGMEFFVKI